MNSFKPFFNPSHPQHLEVFIALCIILANSVLHTFIKTTTTTKVLPSKIHFSWTKTCNLGNEEEELEDTMLLKNHDVVAVIETCWYDSYDWIVAVGNYKLFRRDRWGRRGGSSSISRNRGWRAVHEEWSRARSLVDAVYYKPPDQAQSVDQVFFLQLQEESWSQALILLGDCNHPDIGWKSSTVSCRQSMRPKL